MTEAKWLDSTYPVLSLESHRGWPSPRKQRLLAVACCRRIEHRLPASEWRQVLAAAERYADKKARRAELKPLHSALDGGRVSSRAERSYADLFDELVTLAVHWACHPTERAYAGNAAINAACAAAYAVLPPGERYVPPAESRYSQAWCEAERAEKIAQIALVREVCGDPFHPANARVGQVSRECLRLAQSAYEERLEPSGELEPARLAVLSDALEEAGCTDDTLLSHLRSPAPHVRGCWVLDLILNKN